MENLVSEMTIDSNDIPTIIAIIAAIGVPIAWGARLEMQVKHLKQSDKPKNNDDPLTILRTRLAKGEITPDEFDKLRKKIS